MDDLPPLYKYLNVQGIKLTLGNRTFIVPNLEKDSKFALFRGLEYQDARPPLYDSTLSFLEDGIFGDQEETRKAILDRIVYAKTREWAS